MKSRLTTWLLKIVISAVPLAVAVVGEASKHSAQLSIAGLEQAIQQSAEVTFISFMLSGLICYDLYEIRDRTPPGWVAVIFQAFFLTFFIFLLISGTVYGGITLEMSQDRSKIAFLTGLYPWSLYVAMVVIVMTIIVQGMIGRLEAKLQHVCYSERMVSVIVRSDDRRILNLLEIRSILERAYRRVRHE